MNQFKLTFVSNFFNHHQVELCENFYRVLGDNFRFIATERMPEERIKLGYVDDGKLYPYVINDYDDDEKLKMSLKLITDSEIVIFGSAPINYIKMRRKLKKITFYYSERFYKEGIFDLKNPVRWANVVLNHGFYKKNQYLLCAGAFTKRDYNLSFAYFRNSLKWGYFPRFLDLKDDIQKSIDILWVGRFIDWKHPDWCIDLAKYLISKNITFNICMVGSGRLFENIKNIITNNSLERYITLLGSKNPSEVRELMTKSKVYAFTSDKNEGWGAVLNESMNSKCVPVCNRSIGAVPYLVRNGFNGLVFNKKKDFFRCVETLLLSENSRIEMSNNAFNTIKTEWNADIASNRFLEICSNLLYSSKLIINSKSGPCSKA